MKLTFYQILISRSGVMLFGSKKVVTCAATENKKAIISDAKLQINV